MNERKDVHELNFREMTKEQLAEEALIDLAYAILEDKKEAIPFDELIKLIQGWNGFSDAQIKSRLLQFYTDMNIDGRFLLENEKGWGLREWYKVEQIEEETAPSVKIRKKKKSKAADEDDLEIDLEEEEVGFDEDYEEFVEDDEDEDDEEEVVDVIEFDTPVDIEELDEELDEELIVEEDDEFELEEEEEEEELDGGNVK